MGAVHRWGAWALLLGLCHSTILADQEMDLPPAHGLPGMRESRAAVVVKTFEFSGNTVFTDRELARVLWDYLDRPLTAEQLDAARQAVTLHYINAGYVNSGAVLEDQRIEEGVVHMRIVEGVLRGVEVRGNKSLQAGFVVNRLSMDEPLKLDVLHERLEILRRNPNVQSVQAELVPTGVPGEADLRVQVREIPPLHLGLRFGNQRSPSVGAERLELLLEHNSLLGHSDRFDLIYGITTGGIGEDLEFAEYNDIIAGYAFPLTAAGSTIAFQYRRSSDLVVEDPFRDLNISSRTQGASLTLRHPLQRSLAHELALGATLEYAQNRTFLDGQAISLAPGAEDGRTAVTVVRLFQEYLSQGEQQAIALRSVFNFGVDLFGATNHGGSEPDGQFFAWIGQTQYARRLFGTGNQLMLRASTQLTPDRLLSLEQFSLGGIETVRGYRYNRLVRDNGVVLSAQVLLPLLQKADGQVTLALTPFVDFGHAWNNGSNHDAQSITSAGAALTAAPWRGLTAEFYYGYPFRDFHDEDKDIQDLGIHFVITWMLF